LFVFVGGGLTGAASFTDFVFLAHLKFRFFAAGSGGLDLAVAFLKNGLLAGGSFLKGLGYFV
jgi:hypothetical protein